MIDPDTLAIFHVLVCIGWFIIWRALIALGNFLARLNAFLDKHKREDE